MKWCFGIGVLLFCLSSRVNGEIVFDNITSVTTTGGGMGVVPGTQGGDIVTLGGTSRDITRLDFWLYEFGFGVSGDMTFKVNLWNPSGVDGNPGSLLWTSPTQHAVLQNYRTPMIFSVDVPLVHAPDSLGWTLEGVTNLHSAGVVNGGMSPGNSVGHIIGSMAISPGNPWLVQYNPITGGQGLRILAVPEPTTGLLILLAGSPPICARCRRN